MADANVTDEALTQEPGDVFVSETERKCVLSHEAPASGDFPPSLMSYFETSKSRLKVCEKLILEEVADFTTSYEDLMNLSSELTKNEPDRGNEKASADGCLLPQTEAPVITNVTASPRNDALNTDETQADVYEESEKHRTCTSRLSEFSLTKEERKENNEHQQAHKEKRDFERKKEEQIRQRENDFQMELKKLMEAEKLHQIELQLTGKRAQEKLDQEFLLQQELISNLQKQVEEERRMMAEELKRMKEEEEKKRKEEEEDRKKIEEEKIKREKQRMEERKAEEERSLKEEQRKREEEEETRKREEVRIKMKEEKRKREEEDRKRREEQKIKREKQMMEERKAEEERSLKEEQRKRKEEEETRKREEVRIKMEEEKRKREEEDRKRREEQKIKREKQMMEEEIREENKEILQMRAEEETSLKEEQRKRKEEEETRKREEVRIKMEEEKRKREEEDRKRREEEKMKRDMQQRKMEEEMRRKKEEDRKVTEVELRTKEEEKTKREEEKNKVEEEMTKTNECNKKIWLKEEKTSQMEQMERETNAKKMENKSNPKVQKEEEKAGKREEGKAVMKVMGKNIEKTNEDSIRPIKERRKEEETTTHKENERREETEVTKATDEHTGKREEEKVRTVDGTQLSEDEDKRGKNNFIRKEEEKIIQEEWRKRQEEEKHDHRNTEEEIRSSEEKEEKAKVRKVEDHRNATEQESEEGRTKENKGNLKAEEETETRSNGLRDHKSRTEREATGGAGPLSAQLEDSWSSGLQATVSQACVEQHHAAAQLCSSSTPPPLCPREQRRLSWMNDCISWCKLSLQNRRKQKGCLRGGRLPRRPESSSLPPLSPDTLLQATGCRSFQQVTSVTLEDLPGCSLASLALCSHLQALTLRRCGLTSLEGISQLSHLCYIDVTENHISFVDCEDMSSLRLLRLGYNKLTSIHGLRGADNLDELELSHNNITRIAGLESMRRLQRLSVDHNQLISTKGLRDVYTLLHLNCSHNHLAGVEGLENNALLRTLDLRSNSLPEPPGLNNHVLLRELRLDDNSISSLQALAADCWLPLMQDLSVAQNRITRLPSMSDFVSLANLDLQFNCMSDLRNVCESLGGCASLQHVHVRGNPLQQENGWRSALQKALPGLRAIDDQHTDCFLSPPAVQQISSASDTFLNFCQAQLQQMNDLVQQHSRELSKASSPLDAVKSLCRHFTETFKLAEDQRLAHEYGDITAEGRAESSETGPAVGSSRNDVSSSWTCETSPPERWLQSADAGARETGLNSLSEKRTTSSSDFQMAALSHQDLDHKNSAALVIQQQWRTRRQNHGDISRRPLAASGDGANPEPGPSCQHHAAAVIQASWRGFSVRRRLASALAAITFPSTTEDDTFEEVDMDEFAFDEAELDKHWTLQPSRPEPVWEQPPPPKVPGPLPEPSHNTQPTHPVWRPKQAWVPEDEVAPAGRDSPEGSHRKSPASSSVLSGISERSEKILEEWGFTDSHTALQMLKRAQNMKWKQQKKKHKDPSVGPALFYQLVPVEAGNRAAPRRRALCRTEQQPERTEPVNQESAEQRLHGQSDRSSASAPFLPALSSDVLNGGRVQLVADPVYSERHRASGQRANSASSAQQHSTYPHRISLGRAKTDAASPNGVAAAPPMTERISFRDHVVQLSGGWGGGRKRSNMHK